MSARQAMYPIRKMARVLQVSGSGYRAGETGANRQLCLLSMALAGNARPRPNRNLRAPETVDRRRAALNIELTSLILAKMKNCADVQANRSGIRALQ